MLPFETDSLIISRVLAAAAEGRFFLMRTFATNLGFSAAGGACCAVGAGLLSEGLHPHRDGTIIAFAKHYSVSKAYAIGVSDGFEGRKCTASFDELEDARTLSPGDYEVGLHVGETIAEAVL